MKEQPFESQRSTVAEMTGRIVCRLLQSGRTEHPDFPFETDMESLFPAARFRESFKSISSRMICEMLSSRLTCITTNDAGTILCCGRMLAGFHPPAAASFNLHLHLNVFALWKRKAEDAYACVMVHLGRCSRQDVYPHMNHDLLCFSTEEGFLAEIPVSMLCSVKKWHDGCAFTAWYHPRLLLNVSLREIRSALGFHVFWCSDKTAVNPLQVFSASGTHLIASTGACIDLTQAEWNQYCRMLRKVMEETAYAAI